MIGADFNGHIGEDKRGHEKAKDRFGVQDIERLKNVEVGDHRWTTCPDDLD